MRTATACLIALIGAADCFGCASSAAPSGAAARQAILRVDEEFARYALGHGVADAFAAFAAPDATILTAGGNPVTGRDSIRGFFASASGTV